MAVTGAQPMAVTGAQPVEQGHNQGNRAHLFVLPESQAHVLPEA